jgi:hypothetical protein
VGCTVRVEISSNHYITLVSFVVLAPKLGTVSLLLHMLMLRLGGEHVGRSVSATVLPGYELHLLCRLHPDGYISLRVQNVFSKGDFQATQHHDSLVSC